ncbi:hypothetical protein ESCO_002258 [Escovopsis weberi]|uniref:Mtf2-like C-terminal domain-containing protein n=1 Tax=Escovopsis weberi TaxID=150374 RepID=A0A0M9VW56_ESCWE|nr:hypothetical protein ESCO_002258 [Escovopsis weberi]
MSPSNARTMSSTLLPFLYQTTTLKRALGGVSGASNFARLVHSPRKARTKTRDNSIPFAWDPSEPHASTEVSTITPSEAQIFKNIFDEIAQGKMPAAKKRPSPSRHAPKGARAASSIDAQGLDSAFWTNQDMAGRSPVEQARVTEFREKILRRFPQSLRNAAQVALGLFELKPEDSEEDAGRPRLVEMDGGNQRKWEENAEYVLARTKELERVESLMKSCSTDEELWAVVEQEVFSLPAKLGILEEARLDGADVNEAEEMTGSEDGQDFPGDADSVDPLAESEEQKRIMDIHGPLYSQFINMALGLFDTAFAHSSPYVFQILPRVKELGLPSYVLGVSTPFYSRLAQIHWLRFGDASAAIDALREMNAVGLYADKEVQHLLGTIREQLVGCTWGSQGPFVMAMAESPPYDSSLMQKLEGLEETVKRSLRERAQL